MTIAPTNPPPGAVEAQARLRTGAGLRVDLWAAEPLVQDVTSLAFDGQGRAYVVESGRRRTSVFDVRNFRTWLEDDYALRSVDERDAFLRRMLSPGEPGHDDFLKATAKSKIADFNHDGVIDAGDLEVEQERIRLVWDGDGDGKADSARTFAEGFNGLTSGVAAGVLVQGSNVWFTCIPDVWRFPAAAAGASTGFGEPGGAGAGESSPLSPGHPSARRLLTGFGVHIAFGGHDLHGLQLGPDGRLYFSIADRGASVRTQEGTLVDVPDTGAVFRCEPDGSRLEVVATGLRNPQELTFDDVGNLWTGDNNGDGGDKARWTLVIEGANYGWTIGWQWLPKMGAWNSERLWHTRESNSASHLVPPVAHVGHGPAGIAHYPGTGLGERFRDHFFFADFPGGVRAFKVEPDGAFFRVVGAGPWMEDNSAMSMTGKILWNLAPVDLAFPPGGGLIVADAFPSWEKTGSARLWRVSDAAWENDPVRTEVARLLNEGMARRGGTELVSLLGHRDQRVRLEAQWELAARGSQSVQALIRTAREPGQRLARLHALWGLGQIGRQPEYSHVVADLNSLEPLFSDQDAFAREGVIRLFGETGVTRFIGEILDLCASSEPRVSAAAFRAIGHLQRRREWEAGGVVPSTAGLPWDPRRLEQPLVVAHLDDPVVREAKVDALVALSKGSRALLRFVEIQEDPRVQLLGVLALRRMRQPFELRDPLRSPHPQQVLEAARALHDETSMDSWTLLPSLLGDPEFLANPASNAWPASLNFTREEWRAWILRRVVNATFLLGPSASETNLRALADFAANPGVPGSARVEALEALADWAKPARRDRVLGVHRPRSAGDAAWARAALARVWRDLTSPETDVPVLLASLRAGASLRPEGLAASLAALTQHPAEEVRAEAVRITARSQPMNAARWIARLDAGTLAEQRDALAWLATSDDPVAEEAVAAWMRKLNAGDVSKELQLDVLEAARRAGGDRLESLVSAWDAALSKDDPLAPYRVAIHGGDPASGRRLFAERADWGCQRCHKLHGEGGDVGPDLTGIVRSRGVEHVLDSILLPNKEIAPGFENVLITLASGETLVGMVKEESAEELVIDTGEDGRVTIPKVAITARQRGLSSMVEGLGELIPPRELRDLLAALSEPPSP